MAILWCVTGAGHFLEECIGRMEALSEKEPVITVFSNAGFEVARAYGLLDRIEKIACETILEKDQGASAPFVSRLQKKEYSRVYVAPCTGNTAAKIVCGIADTLVSNLVAQAGKCKVPVTVLPTDAVKVQKTRLPIYINDRCRKCSDCAAIKACPQGALRFADRLRADLLKCTGCRKCVTACHTRAIEFGKEVSIECREVDLDNARLLEKIEGLTVVKSPEAIN